MPSSHWWVQDRRSYFKWASDAAACAAFVVGVAALGGLAAPAEAAERVPASKGEIRLEVTKNAPKLIDASGLTKYFSSALRASYLNDSEGAIGVSFRAALVNGEGDVVGECASRAFEIAPGKPVESQALARGFENCFILPGKDNAARFQLADLGSAPEPVLNPNLGLWNPNLGLWARRKVEDADYVIVIALVPADNETAEMVTSTPHVFTLKYPIEHG